MNNPSCFPSMTPSPRDKILMGLMNPDPSSGLTTEHIKSHLQKFRLHYAKSPAEFITYYEVSQSVSSALCDKPRSSLATSLPWRLAGNCEACCFLVFVVSLLVVVVVVVVVVRST